jgi:hypothetical protein
MHVRTHARARTLARGKDKIRHPDMAIERGSIELTALLVQQFEWRNLAQNRQRLFLRTVCK